ncbi:MAG: sugar phosphate isomerase/epimerase family protein [Phycisphaerales bacterium JB059]
MLMTLSISSIRSLLKKRGAAPPKLDLLEVPQFTREELGLHGLTLTTDLLAGSTRDRLVGLREAGDKAGCAALVLIEPDALPLAEPAESKGEQATERMRRVLEAARLLGCSSVGFSIKGKDDEASFERACERLKPIVDLGERMEINVLIRPTRGLTQTPERTIELVKKVGGFRIGTLPDFQSAAESEDPGAYLRRLTPYASALLATTVELEQPEAPEPEAPAKKAGSKKGADTGGEAEEAKGDAAAEPEGEASGDDELSLEGLPEELLADLEAMIDETPAPVHVTYDLAPMIEAIKAVGYDQTLSIDYRGSGDGTLGSIMSREAIEAVFESLADG